MTLRDRLWMRSDPLAGSRLLAARLSPQSPVFVPPVPAVAPPAVGTRARRRRNRVVL